MLTGYSEKPIKGVAASEVPEVSLLYACIDLNSHSEHVLVMLYMCRINTEKNTAYCQFSGLHPDCVPCTAQILDAVRSIYIISKGSCNNKIFIFLCSMFLALADRLACTK